MPWRLGRIALPGAWRARKRDVVKVGIARRLRAETTMSLEWVADHLGLSGWGYLSKLLSAGTSWGERQSDGTHTTASIGK